ncbi:MAG: NADH-quinone oxidoreductase subunit NuoF [Defluviitaleaceae bacterium]|nr:NADH-quinone oxidoreductase subunit NuoF [Defluviitaleaceae bacterium]MCL2263283.1 NADH-quinone oxidoreductase subunit NuoF [Defluviitaleaceae bacterium]
MCYAEPLVEIKKQGKPSVFVSGADAETARKVVAEYLDGGDSSAVLPDTRGDKQTRIALRNCGVIDPTKIDDYIAVGGYEALAKVLTEMGREGVISEMKKSGLRGRGGAGFSTGLKWEFGAKSEGAKKYIICNADEGDPGAFMDRSILEGDPHSVLEAMAIAAFAVGADEGIFYIRAEYPLAVKRLETAIAQATELGLLGDNIMGTGFDFKLSISLGAGAFVCGEETALLNSLEGKRGEPRLRPPFPAQKGLWDKPTVNNNVETYANIPAIILRGADWFRSVGTEKCPGTKVFALAGKINNVGLVEVPMGTTLREIVYEIGGGLPDGKAFKAIQTGGPSGGCIPAQHLDMGVDYESLGSIGSMMGSGGMIVMDEDDCMVNIAKFYLDFTMEESCGKCTPCRIGNTRLHEILEKITDGNGTEDDLTQLKDLAQTIKSTSLCGLGNSAPNPVLSTLHFFADEYLAHVNEKKCPSHTCKNLIRYIITEKCIGCGICAKVCPVNCISGEPKKLHSIDQSRCIKCGECLPKCPSKVGAIVIE